MIRNILILDDGGRVLVARTYDETMAIGRELVGSFLSAVSLFGQETFSEQVREITLAKRRILLQRNKNFYVVVMADLDNDLTKLDEILKGISRKLLSSHNDNFSKPKLLSQQTINRIEQVIDHFVPPPRSFESNIAESADE